MNYIQGILIILFSISLVACSNTSQEDTSENKEKTEKIVSLTGAITEALYYLGQGENIVGVDVTSTYPEEVSTKTKLGHIKRLSTEGVLGLAPTIVLADEGNKDSPALQTLEKAGIKVVYVPTENTLENGLNICKFVAKELGISATEKLQSLENEVSEVKKKLGEIKLQHKDDVPSVLFIYARGAGHMMIGGKGTSAQAMIELAGAKNATEVEQFQSYSTEGLVKAQPDAILLFKSGLSSLGGEEAFLKTPGIKETPAGKNNKIITMDGAYLLGFGPRCHKAALELAERIQSL